MSGTRHIFPLAPLHARVRQGVAVVTSTNNLLSVDCSTTVRHASNTDTLRPERRGTIKATRYRPSGGRPEVRQCVSCSDNRDALQAEAHR